MADQLDLLDFLGHAKHLPATVKQSLLVDAPPQPCGCTAARRCPPYIAAALGQTSPASLAALAGVTLLHELPGDRVAIGPVGWAQAMAHRAHLVAQQIARTLPPGDAEALAALQRLHISWAGETPDYAVIVPAHALDDLHNALAGLRCAAMEDADG